MRKFRVWAAPLALAAIAVGVVLAAPLASPNKAAAGPIISGARTLSDRVTVSFAAVPPGHETSDVHILAFNDLHGTLDPGASRTIRVVLVAPLTIRQFTMTEQGQFKDAAGITRSFSLTQTVVRRRDRDAFEQVK